MKYGEQVSPVCEVWRDGRSAESMCGKLTAYWYPAWGGGSMALCLEHAQPHLRHGEAINLTAYSGSPA